MRKQLQALFVVFHLGAVAVLSIPPPPPAMQGRPGNSEVSGAVEAWAQAAGTLGIDPGFFTRAVHRGSSVWAGVLVGIQDPLRPYARATGAEQSWRMFGVVPATGAELEIDIRREGAWQPLYRIRSREHDWQAGLLCQERMRALVNGFERRKRRSVYDAFVRWLAGRARDEGLAGDALRVRMHGVRIPDAATLRATGRLEARGVHWELEVPL